MRWIRCIAAMLSLVAIGPVAVAQAHEARAYHPSDPSYAVLKADHHNVAVCDWHADGHKVYARVWQIDTPEYVITDYDEYGGGCHNEFFAFYKIYRFAVCVQYEGCSAWKDHGY